MAVYQTQGGAWDRGPDTKRIGKSAALAAGAVLAAAGGQASAAVIEVDSLADDVTAGDSLCTLREAVSNANADGDTTGGDCVAGAGTDTIDLSALTGAIILGGTHLRLTDSATVQGPTAGTLTINGNNTSRIFYVRTAGVSVTISRLTLTGGRNSNGAAIRFEQSGSLTIDQSVITGNTSTSKGGALFFRSNSGGVSISNTTVSSNTAGSGGAGLFLYNVAGTSSITNSTISGNSGGSRGSGIFLYKINAPLTISNTTISGNSNSNGRGGGVFFYKSSAPGTLTVERSTISGNTAGQGGGFFFYRTNSTLRLENTTISGNTATAGKGGGIYLKGSFGGSQLTDIRSSTIASNTASGSGGNLDGGNSANTINITNSIIAGGTAPTGPDINKGNATINMNYSLLQDTSSAAVVGANNVTGVDPQLGALGNNGGATLTRLIANTSPARNVGSNTFVTVAATDQRGLTRVVGGTIDMGAVEIQPVVPTDTASKIPTLSQWALALLATLLAWVGFRRYPKV
ncbi:MAG: IPTL-CTERM sorting domain-containing protein [Acidovorax sp.]|uniref:IPTL-CTERM sorting domain-containing protein n=1 Tax=Acidovorax sp. TaxID=1872122 RepID=UPI00391B5F54